MLPSAAASRRRSTSRSRWGGVGGGRGAPVGLSGQPCGRQAAPAAWRWRCRPASASPSLLPALPSPRCPLHPHPHPPRRRQRRRRRGTSRSRWGGVGGGRGAPVGLSGQPCGRQAAPAAWRWRCRLAGAAARLCLPLPSSCPPQPPLPPPPPCRRLSWATTTCRRTSRRAKHLPNSQPLAFLPCVLATRVL